MTGHTHTTLPGDIGQFGFESRVLTNRCPSRVDLTLADTTAPESGQSDATASSMGVALDQPGTSVAEVFFNTITTRLIIAGDDYSCIISPSVSP